MRLLTRFGFGKTRRAGQLQGVWRLFRTEAEESAKENVSLEFTADGCLIYVIQEEDQTSIINLVYTVDGDELVTDQPSSPRTERSRFWFESDEVLVLEYDGQRSWYQRC